MIESLPNRPLRRNEVTALESSDSVDLSKQLAEQQTTDSEAVVGVYLALGETIHLLGYTPDRGWERITSLTDTAEAGLLESAVDEFLAWLDGNYDEDDVAVTIEDRGVESALVGLLPNRPAGKEEILQIDEMPNFDIVPVFALEDTHEIVCVVGITTAPDGSLTRVVAGYLEETGWDVVDTETVVLGEEPEPDMETAFEWVEEHYGDDVVVIDNRSYTQS